MMQFVSSVTSRHDNSWTEIPVLSLFSNRARHSYVWASCEIKLLTLRLYSKNSRLFFLSCNEQICACGQVKH